MKIKFQGLEPIEGTRKDGTVWTGTKIKGIRYDNGGDWLSAGIFDSDNNFKDAIEELRTTDQGTPVEVVHKKNGKFWDIIEIKIGDDVSLDPQVVRTSPTTGALPRQSGGVRRADGGTRGDDTNRSAAIYLAKEYAPEYGPVLFGIAQEILGFIKDGVVPAMGDPLEPPKEE